MKKYVLLFLSFILAFLVVVPASSQSYAQSHAEFDLYDKAYQEAMEARAQESQFKSREKRYASLIRLAAIVVVKGATYYARRVSATPKNVVTRVSGHVFENLAEHNITTEMLDDVLSEKPRGMLAIQKFDDVDMNSRVMVDPNTGVVVAINKTNNEIITVYKDNSNSISKRPKVGRWITAYWNYQ